MNSQINSTENKDSMMDDKGFRSRFYDRPTAAAAAAASTTKNVNVVATVSSSTNTEKNTNTPANSSSQNSTNPSPVPTPTDARHSRFGSARRNRSRSLPNITFHHRRYRSQPAATLKNMGFNEISNSVAKPNSLKSVFKISKSGKRSRKHHHPNMSFNGMDTELAQLPPVNTDSLKEIDLQEILKNPQLRHDILFDPQLQFRPNLDGERGRRKKMMVDKYWTEVELECREYRKLSTKILTSEGTSSLSANLIRSQYKYSKLPSLFKTLRDILISLLPPKEKSKVYDVMDVDLYIQQLRKDVVDFVSLAKWLSTIFKSYCAPMRDPWVDEMTEKFVKAGKENSIKKLIDGLRTVFSILEAMKLDIANHQIRVLRPVLVETAVDFERDYFNQMLNRRKLNINDSYTWYGKHYHAESTKSGESSKDSNPNFARNVAVSAIIKLLSCREMTSEFPSSLLFDHSRLILLRADVRQLVCLQICLYLYKQLVSTFNSNDSSKKAKLCTKACLSDVKREILAVISDEDGNVKWTRNIPSIAVQLAKRATSDPNSSVTSPPPASVVNFAHSWLVKQTQPNSDVYGLMEQRIFNQLKTQIISILDNHKSGNIIGMKLNSAVSTPVSSGTPCGATFSTPITPTSSSSSSSNSSSNNGGQLSEEIGSLALKSSILINFHWSVFSSHYLDSLKAKTN